MAAGSSTRRSPTRRLVGLALLASVSLPAACDCGGPSPLTPLRPDLVVSPSALDLGEVFVGASAEAEVVVRNAGGAPGSLSATVVGRRSFALEGAAPTALAAGASTTLRVRFAPAGPGAERDGLLLESDGLAGGSLEVELTGLGVAAPVCVGGPCLQAAFDPELGFCVTVELDGPCDDGSSCTEAGTCVDGVCVAPLVDCGEPAADCLVPSCDPVSGCAFEPLHEACDDDDPCTDDVCTEAGCTHAPLPEGTPCAPFACDALSLCLGGACVTDVAPDDFPCSDDDGCTELDTCQAGVCTGVAVAAPAAEVGSAFTFGAPGALAVVLEDGSLVVRDASYTGEGELWTLLGLSAGDLLTLEVLGRVKRPVPLSPAQALVPAGGDRFVALDDHGGMHHLRLAGSGLEELGQRQGELVQGVPSTGVAVYLGGSRIAHCLPTLDNALRVLDLSGSGDPALVEAIPLPAPCRDLAATGPSSAWAVLVDGSLVELDWSAPNPDPVHRIVTGRFQRVAAAPGLVVTGSFDDEAFLANDLIEVRDPGTLDVVASWEEYVSGIFGSGLTHLDLVGPRLFVLAHDHVVVFDVSTPTAPAELERLPDGPPGQVSSPTTAFTSDGRWVVRSSLGRTDNVFRMWDVTGPLLRPLSHADLGAVLELRQVGDHVLGLHERSVRRLAPGPQGATIEWGHTLQRRGDRLWSTATASEQLRFPVGHRKNGTFTGSGALSWWHTANDLVLDVGPTYQPFGPGVLSVASDGALGWAVRMDNDNLGHLDVYDLLLLEANVDDSAPPLLFTLPLDWAGADRNTFTHLELTDATAPGAPALATVVMQRDWSFDTPEAELRSEMGLYRRDPAPALVPLAHASLPGLYRHAVAVDENTVLAVKSSGLWLNGEYAGTDVVRLVRNADELVVDASLPLEGGGAVVWADGTRALVARQGGASFLGHGPGLLAEGTFLALLAPPTAALEVEGHVWLATAHGVVTVRPPCD